MPKLFAEPRLFREACWSQTDFCARNFYRHWCASRRPDRPEPPKRTGLVQQAIGKSTSRRDSTSSRFDTAAAAVELDLKSLVALA